MLKQYSLLIAMAIVLVPFAVRGADTRNLGRIRIKSQSQKNSR